MMGIKRCPKCGNERLLARKITGVQVESLDNGEFKINAEGPKYQLEIVGCAKCKAEFNESELVEMVQCKKCGKYVNSEDLNNNGECDICQALSQRPELAEMSKEDILRMMLKLERNTLNVSPASTPIVNTQEVTPTQVSSVAEEKMKAAQAAINNTSNNFSKEIIKETEQELKIEQEQLTQIQQAMNPPVENIETEEAGKPRRGRKPRKKTETSEEEIAEVQEVSEEQVEQSANEIAEFQEAPFPEQDNEMKQMFEEPVPQEQTVPPVPNQSSSPFQMFDEEQSF